MQKMKLVIAGLFVLVAGTSRANPSAIDNGKKSRAERREERRELTLHRPNAATSLQFKYDFPDAEAVNWTKGQFEEATFLEEGVQKTAYYDYDAELIGTTTLISFADLPSNAQEKIKKEYPGYTVEHVIKYEDNKANDDYMVLYGNPLANEDGYFPILKKGNEKILLHADPAGYTNVVKKYEEQQ